VIVWAVFAALLGCAIVYRFCAVNFTGPWWASALLVFGAGTALGIGLTSCLFLVCKLAAPGVPKLALFVEIACFGRLAAGLHRPKWNVSLPFPKLALALGAAALITSTAMWTAWKANPQGNWDAWAMWNLRARFLAADGDLPRRAWSPALAEVHPEYPLLLPSFVARCWTYSGSAGTAAPITAAYLFFLALLATLAGGFALLRGPTAGILLGLTLLGTPTLLHEVWAQYADVPLTCYFAGAMIFVLLDRPILAGVFAGLASWTKDEGVLFLAVFLVATLFLRRSKFSRVLIGAIPGTCVAALFKLTLAPAGPMYFRRGLSTLIERATEPGRLPQIAAAFSHQLSVLHSGWYHPLWPVVALMVTLRFQRGPRPEFLFCAFVPAVMLAGYFSIFLITPYPLPWQLGSSLDRLMVQLWPLLLLALFIPLHFPESAPTA